MQKKLLLFFLFYTFSLVGFSQFYTGYNQKFGKNRVQYDEFVWTYYKFEDQNIYYNAGGEELAKYTAQAAIQIKAKLEKKFDFSLDEKVHFILYNKVEHFRQSNIGLRDDNSGVVAGTSQSSGTKIFLYFTGNHKELETQIRRGLAEIMVSRLLYGRSWKEVLKNTALLSLPDWYINGLVSYATNGWNTEVDNYVRDGIVSQKFVNFNRLTGNDAKYAGHALWNYIAETYGEEVVPNVLYMARISRNVENGFSYVIGSSFNQLTIENFSYYKAKYNETLRGTTPPKSDDEVSVKIKKDRLYTQFKVGPNSNIIAYSSNKMGLTKVYVYDLDTKKRKKILRYGHSLERINDSSYPLLVWHPNGEVLSIFYEWRGKIILKFYNTKTKEVSEKNLFKLEKVLDASYSTNGKKMVISGINKGRSDIYEYTIASNYTTALTKDEFDDLNPRYIENDSKIIFSSNRLDDTLRFSKTPQKLVSNNFDLYSYQLYPKSLVLQQLTQTPNIRETHPIPVDSNRFVFLSDENGIENRHLAYFDSVISHIDTIVHFKHITVEGAITYYPQSILDQDANKQSKQLSEIIYSNHQYHLYKHNFKEEFDTINKFNSPVQQDTTRSINNNVTTLTHVKQGSRTAHYETIITDLPNNNNNLRISPININDYPFSNNKKKKKKEEHKINIPKPIPIDTILAKEIENRPVKLLLDTNQTAVDTSHKPHEFKMPNSRKYRTVFTASEITTKLNYQYANPVYQKFNGGPYIKPSLGVLLQVELNSLFEDYKLTGGMRLGGSSGLKEYFLTLDNRKKRLDKSYSLRRQSLKMTNQFGQSIKTVTNSFNINLSYPLNEVAAFQFAFLNRLDKDVVLSRDRSSLESPNTSKVWSNLKAAFVFDNTQNKGLNLYNGTRFKLFAESFNNVYEKNATDNNVILSTPDMYVVGFDFRNYQKIHRNLIWASRFSGSSSFGSQKLLYYMGGMDNWITRGGNSSFIPITDSPIATNQNFAFQTVATNMRGFKQNIRNGNNYLLINNEIRWPIFKYFSKRPVKYDFIKNFQVVGFGDVGTAWAGSNPYSKENETNNQEIKDGPIKVILRQRSNPIIGGMGFGFRSRLLGYFMKLDFAWGIQDGIIQKNLTYVSIGYDF